MTWLTWRQFRTSALTVYAAMAAVAVVLSLTGPRLLAMARAHPTDQLDQLTARDRNLYYGGVILVAVAPAILGAFWGAPLVARELEAGTHRLVWNQGVTRNRWLATKLGLTALSTAVAASALSLAVTKWAAPLDGVTGSTTGALPPRLTPIAFAMRGIVPAGYAVFALVLGVCAGVVLRRTVPAMAVTLAVFVAVQIAVPLWVRPHLVLPVRQTVAITSQNVASVMLTGPGGPMTVGVRTGSHDDWILTNRTIDTAGQEVAALPSWFPRCIPPPDHERAGGKTRFQACLDRLGALGYRQRLVYQPADRFWALQWAETALFLAVSGLLAWFCFWWTRRRLS